MKLNTLPALILRKLLRAYQLGVSPFIVPSCRFYPTCSNYALQAIATHGAGKGSLLAARRLCKCHPWHPGGVDLVPPASSPCSSPTANGCNHS